MGAYLSEPVTEKNSMDEKSERLSYGASSMQGWRRTQEDAHNCIIEFDKNTSFFAVYDGHGGAEVAKYCEFHLPEFLHALPEYKNGNLEEALEVCFLDFDSSLTKPEVISELKDLADIKGSSESVSVYKLQKMNLDLAEFLRRDLLSTNEDEDTETLNQEADMPLDQVLARYKSELVPMKVAPHLKNLDDKPKSPMLRAKKEGLFDSSEEENSTDMLLNRLNEKKLLNGEDTNADTTKEQQQNITNSANNISSDLKDPTDKCDSEDKDTESKLSGKGNFEENPEKSKDQIPSEEPCSSNLQESSSHKKEIDSSDTSDDDYGESDSEKESDEADDEEGDDDEEEEDEEEEEDDHPGILFADKEEPGSDSGCTAVVTLIRGNKMYVANAGDSRCVIKRNGKILDMSIDHKPEDEVERLRIEKAGGEVTPDGRVNGGLNLSRAIGDHSYKRNKDLTPREQMITALPDVRVLTIEPDDDFMVIACDGIWNYMTSQEVMDFVQERMIPGKNLSKICEELFDYCLAPNTRGDGTGCDNMTCIIIKFHNLLAERSDIKRPFSELGDSEETTSKKLKS